MANERILDIVVLNFALGILFSAMNFLVAAEMKGENRNWRPNFLIGFFLLLTTVVSSVLWLTHAR